MAVTPDGRRAVSASGTNAAALGPGERPNAPHARRPYGLGQRRGGDARRPPCRLGIAGQHAAGLGPGERPNDSARSKAIRSRVRAVAVTPDGRRAVSGSDDRTLRLWDLESGQTTPHARRPYGARSGPWRSRPTAAVPSRPRRTKRCGSGTWRAAKHSARSKAIRAGSGPWR